MNRIVFVFLVALFVVPFRVSAHQPVVEPTEHDYEQNGLYFRATPIADPTEASQALYGRISEPGEFDLYVFVPKADTDIPLELLVPLRATNTNFKPSLVVIGPTITEKDSWDIDLQLPETYGRKVIPTPGDRDKHIFFEPFSLERLYHGAPETLHVQKDKNYFLAIYDPHQQIGDYVLGVGDKESWNDVSKLELAQNFVTIKLGLIGGYHIPWLDVLGLFIMLAGFVIGLGAVTVIDWHGFLARRSTYWTEATIRSHKITKPLIWLGILLVIGGGAILYRQTWLSGVAVLQALLIVCLIINGAYLSFVVSPMLQRQEQEGRAQELLEPHLQRKIFLSFLISFLGWWSCLFLVVWYVLIMR